MAFRLPCGGGVLFSPSDICESSRIQCLIPLFPLAQTQAFCSLMIRVRSPGSFNRRAAPRTCGWARGASISSRWSHTCRDFRSQVESRTMLDTCLSLVVHQMFYLMRRVPLHGEIVGL